MVRIYTNEMIDCDNIIYEIVLLIKIPEKDS